MNTGQMMMAIGAMLLLSTVMLRVNSNNMINGTLRDEAQFGVLATSIATSIIEDASSKAFDEKSDTSSIKTTTDLSEVADLGPDGSETYHTFNDFDDYKGLTMVDSTMPSASFNISCDVNYVSSASGVITTSLEKTWHKQITVKVSSPFMKDTVRATSIFSYWTFR